jgi:sec-independent protein translocase protein TatA
MGSIGVPELIVIFVIALLVFGPRKLPDIGKSLGRTMAEFRKASNELRSTLEEEIRIEDHQTKVTPPATVPQPAPPEATAGAPMPAASGAAAGTVPAAPAEPGPGASHPPNAVN